MFRTIQCHLTNGVHHKIRSTFLIVTLLEGGKDIFY